MSAPLAAETDAPAAERFTTWFNPLPTQAQRFTVETAPGGQIVGRRRDELGNEVNVYSQAKHTTYEIPPLSSRRVPSAFDHAVHRVYDREIIGGLCPMLIRADPPQDYGCPAALVAMPEPARPHGGLTAAELSARLRESEAAPADLMTKARSRRGGADAR